MAARSGTENVLADYFGVRLNSERLFSFVWTMIRIYDPQFKLQNIEVKFESRKEITYYLNTHQSIHKEIKNHLQNNIIPDENFIWIKDEKRQSKWIINYIKSRLYHINHDIPLPIHLSNRNRSIAFFDCWPEYSAGDPSQRILFVRQMRDDWENHIKPDRHFDWLAKNGSTEKIKFFHDWLSSNKNILTGNIENLQNYEDVLILSDYLKWSPEAIILFNQRAQATWRQKQQRARDKNKRQCNFILANSTIENLEKLAQKYRSNRTEIIELLINEESKNEYHINQWRLHPLSPDAYKTD